MTEQQVDWPKLFEAADQARRKAYAPYSKFQVGAALLAADGTIVAGCNVENASYGLTVCAERNAINAAVLAGEVTADGREPKRQLLAIAIVVDSRDPTPPCGMCRQVIAEFANDSAPIASRTVSGKEARWTLGELLPHAFRRSFL